MEKDMIINQVRLVYDCAYAALEKSVKNRILIDPNTMDQIVAGLWLIVKDTLVESWHLKNKISMPEAEDNASPREETDDNTSPREEVDDDVPVPVVSEEQRKRYAGDAMIKDDISRHSKYDLKGVDFSIPLVEWVDNVDGHDVWRAFVEFLIEGKLTDSSFKFSEAGSAITNSVKAFDYMVSCLPQLGLRFKEDK